MAGFNINIAAQVNTPYTGQALKMNRTNCSAITETIPLGIYESSNTPGVEFLLETYTGIGWKTLKISDIEYSNESFYLEHAGSKLIPNVDPDVVLATIDISSVAVNTAVPTLQLELDALTLTQNEYLKFTIDIEDTGLNYGGKIDVYYYLIVNECPPTVPAKSIIINSEVENSCFSSKTITITVPAEESRYVYASVPATYGSIDGLYGAFTPVTITGNTQYVMKVEGASASPSMWSTLIIYVKQSASSTSILSSTSIRRQHNAAAC